MTTFSPLLGFWEGTPGDPAIKNVWGGFLNENFNLIEQAITGDNGYENGRGGIDLTGLTRYTMTSVAGLPDQSRQFLYPFKGILTSNCLVQIPNTVKFGFVINSTGIPGEPGFNVILSAGSGSLIATIPADYSMYFFYCDGQNNVVLPGVGLSGLNLTGSLNVASAIASQNISAASIDAEEITVRGTTAGANVPQWQQIFAGFNAIWNDSTSIRALGTVYNNITQRPIQISVILTATSAVTVTGLVNGVIVSSMSMSSGQISTLSMVVPYSNMSLSISYEVNISGGTATLTKWLEL